MNNTSKLENAQMYRAWRRLFVIRSARGRSSCLALLGFTAEAAEFGCKCLRLSLNLLLCFLAAFEYPRPFRL